MAEKRVLFITVGTTALTAEELVRDNDGAGSALLDEIRAFRQNPAEFHRDGRELNASGNRLMDAVLERHRTLWRQNPVISEAMHQTSAEMTSTYLLTHTSAEQSKFRAGHDLFVLLSSDTDEGEFCARVNARLIHEFLFNEPGCACHAAESERQPCENVKIEVVDGLEAATFTGTVSAAVFRILNRHRSVGQLLCNITGGYKGTVPAITAWAKQYGANLYYQHMSSVHTVRIRFRPGSDQPEEVPVTPLPPHKAVGA